tara:strand:+ start:676 stop:867 length:192 start_codon:yes stop_codon:yes gene_type:complete
MDYRNFIRNLPINNFHRFSDYEDWLDFYSSFYPTEEERMNSADISKAQDLAKECFRKKAKGVE